MDSSAFLDRFIFLAHAQILVGGPDDTVGEDDLLHAVGAPTRHTGNGKQRGVDVLGDAQHVVDQPAEQVHVGADGLRAALFLSEDAGGQPLDAAQHVVLFLKAFLVGQVSGAVLQDDLAGVAHGIDRVAHAVDEAGAVARLLTEDAAEILADLVVIVGVLDMLQDILQLTVDHQVRTAVLGAFQCADGRCDGRIGVGARRGQHTGGEGGAVAAAMVRVDQQAHIQQLGLLVGELLVRAVGAEDVLRRALAGLGQMEEHALLIVIAALHLVGVDHHGGHACNEVDALVQDVLQAQVLGVLIVGIQTQHTTLQLVHHVGRRRVHGVHEAIGQCAVLGQQRTEIVQLGLGGQTAEQQQPDDLLKDEAVVAVGFFHDLLDVDTAVDQLAGDGDDMPLLVLFVADDVAHVGQACQHTGAIRIAQAALDPQPLTGLRVDVVVGNVLFAECLHRLRVQRCHFCMLIVHAQIPLSVSNFLYLSLPSALMAHVYHSAFVK